MVTLQWQRGAGTGTGNVEELLGAGGLQRSTSRITRAFAVSALLYFIKLYVCLVEFSVSISFHNKKIFKTRSV